MLHPVELKIGFIRYDALAASEIQCLQYSPYPVQVQEELPYLFHADFRMVLYRRDELFNFFNLFVKVIFALDVIPFFYRYLSQRLS